MSGKFCNWLAPVSLSFSSLTVTSFCVKSMPKTELLKMLFLLMVLATPLLTAIPEPAELVLIKF